MCAHTRARTTHEPTGIAGLVLARKLGLSELAGAGEGKDRIHARVNEREASTEGERPEPAEKRKRRAGGGQAQHTFLCRVNYALPEP